MTKSNDQDGSNYTCSGCGKTYKFKRALQKHQHSCDGEVNNQERVVYKFSCPACDEQFKSDRAWEKHIGTCQENAYLDCGKNFQDILNAHSQSCDKYESNDNYICEKCGQKFQFNRVLKKHRYSCDEDGSVIKPCPDCDKRPKQILNEHHNSCDDARDSGYACPNISYRCKNTEDNAKVSVIHYTLVQRVEKISNIKEK